MDDKVNLSIEQIENGYILRRSWTEKKEGAKEGCCDREYKSEEHFFKELPEGFDKYMVKGKIGEEAPKDMDEADARAEYVLKHGSKKEDEKEEEEEA